MYKNLNSNHHTTPIEEDIIFPSFVFLLIVFFFEDFFDFGFHFPFLCFTVTFFFGFACFSLLLYTCFLLWIWLIFLLLRTGFFLWLLISTRDQNEYPKTSFSHFLKYWENKEIFTIDNTIALKKTFTILIEIWKELNESS